MDIAQARKRANHAVWIGSEAIYVWHKKDASVERVELPPAGPVPYVPRFQGVWEEASQKAFQSQLTSALGGRLRIRMSDILVAIPDDATWIETRALQDFFLMSGSGAPDKKLFFYSQSVLLGPSEHSFIAVTWSCRCFSVCLIQNGTVQNRIHLAAGHCKPEDLDTAIRSINFGSNLPIYYSDAETAPISQIPGTAVPMGQLFTQ